MSVRDRHSSETAPNVAVVFTDVCLPLCPTCRARSPWAGKYDGFHGFRSVHVLQFATNLLDRPTPVYEQSLLTDAVEKQFHQDSLPVVCF